MSELSSQDFVNKIKALEEHIQELEFFQHLDRELHQILDLNHVLDITLDWAIRGSAADTGLVAKHTEEGLQVIRVTGYAYQYSTKLMREPLPIDTGILGRCVTSGNPIYMAYVTNAADHQLIYEKTRSYFTIPLQTKDKVLGVLHLESRQPAHFNQPMRDFLLYTAERSAIALRNADLYSRTRNAEQLKSDMIRMAAHDLRNPLNSVVNATHLLKRLQEQMPPAAGKFIQGVEQAAHQMRMLIEELLTLERLESGMEITPDSLDLVKVLSDALARTKLDSTTKAQEIEVNTPDTPVIVRGEFAYFRQSMVNLINNAIKYTPQRGKITVRLERHGDRIFFDVTDNGYGISEERQKRLFQRFYRAHEPGTEHIGGTGLGLSLVRTIIERSDGEVWFKSQVGKGSTFGFWLPTFEDEDIESVSENTQQAVENTMFTVTREKDETISKPKISNETDTSPLEDTNLSDAMETIESEETQ